MLIYLWLGYGEGYQPLERLASTVEEAKRIAFSYFYPKARTVHSLAHEIRRIDGDHNAVVIYTYADEDYYAEFKNSPEGQVLPKPPLLAAWRSPSSPSQ